MLTREKAKGLECQDKELELDLLSKEGHQRILRKT